MLPYKGGKEETSETAGLGAQPLDVSLLHQCWHEKYCFLLENFSVSCLRILLHLKSLVYKTWSLLSLVLKCSL